MLHQFDLHRPRGKNTPRPARTGPAADRPAQATASGSYPICQRQRPVCQHPIRSTLTSEQKPPGQRASNDAAAARPSAPLNGSDDKSQNRTPKTGRGSARKQAGAVCGHGRVTCGEAVAPTGTGRSTLLASWPLGLLASWLLGICVRRSARHAETGRAAA